MSSIPQRKKKAHTTGHTGIYTRHTITRPQSRGRSFLSSCSRLRDNEGGKTLISPRLQEAALDSNSWMAVRSRGLDPATETAFNLPASGPNPAATIT